MTPRSDYPVETSSSPETKKGLTDDGEEPWKPEDSDDTPTVTITVTDEDEDVPIKTVTVTEEKTKNVDKVTVVVKDKDNNPVVRFYIMLHLLFFTNCSICFM